MAEHEQSYFEHCVLIMKSIANKSIDIFSKTNESLYHNNIKIHHRMKCMFLYYVHISLKFVFSSSQTAHFGTFVAETIFFSKEPFQKHFLELSAS